MEKPQTLLLFLVFLTIGASTVTASSLEHRHHVGGVLSKTKLFVFGDSYADTGNNVKSSASSWKVPYGISFPGRPSGRWSNGRVFTDYFASFLGIRSPIPYKWRKIGSKLIPFGMNFAYGGTGVFNTLVPEHNMTAQIDLFQQVISTGVYTKQDLKSSIVLASVAGNDYTTYNARNGSAKDLPAFITSVVGQLTLNLKRIYGLGVGKIAIAAIEPMGCLPELTALSSYTKCNETANAASNFHNVLLKQAVAKLNNDTKGSPFVFLDVYSAFMTVFNSEKQGKPKFKNVLKPCCLGTSSGYSCGSVDEIGAKKYTVCKNPGSAFFWDSVHPSQHGWRSVYSVLRPSLHKIFHNMKK